MTEPLEPADPKGTVVSPATAFPVVQDHELVRLIGSGSGGQVWLARNALGRYRAVKVVYERTFRHRRPFEREFNGVLKFEPVSRLHDGFVDVLQVGRNEAAGYFYCVMELGDDIRTGQDIDPEHYSPRTLAYDIAQHRRLPISKCVYIGATVASAMSFLHRQGLIHRDIKPSNIIFVDGQPKLADIGLVAEMSEAQSYVGTEGFIPPEGPGTAQADIYSLGKVLYEISTGQDRIDYPELPDQMGNTAADRDLINFNKIVLKACRSDPRQRYKTAEEMVSALVGFQYCCEDPAKEKTRQKLVKMVGIAGVFIAIVVITVLVWRLIWLLKHGL